ncbi:MAG TPA: hypothetical protein VFP59_00945 [Candidatus Angelobacter sp.]|nr:hypothetical protein [Candidatus Angelobacter sp.]
MAVSRRIFLRGGMLAAAYAASPFKALAANRALTAETGLQSDGSLPRTSFPQTIVSQPNFPQNGGHHAVPTPGGEGGTLEQKYAGLSHIHQDAFTQCIGSAFKVTSASGDDSGVFWLTLLRVQDMPAPVMGNPANMAVPPPAGYVLAAQSSAFVLEFSGGPASGVGQDTYFFQHDDLGEFALLIVPSGPEQYVGTINRLQTLKAISV